MVKCWAAGALIESLFKMQKWDEENLIANAGRKVLSNTWSIVRNNFLPQEPKMAMYKEVLLYILLYRSKKWICHEKHKSKLSAIEMDCAS